MFQHVRYCRLASGLGEEGQVKALVLRTFWIHCAAKFLRQIFRLHSRISVEAVLWALCASAVPAFALVVATGAVAPKPASNLNLPSDAQKVLDTIYSGNPEEAVPLARAIEQARPQDPTGYLVEGEALWWQRYCAACEIKYGMIEAWKHEKKREDEAYFALTDKAAQLAQAQLAHSETADMHVYAGMAYALKVRVYGLRNENRNAARAAVTARTHMLRALELDAQAADATAALGLYNYYVDTLSPVVKLLRFFMGIPGGDKEKGVQQMEVGMNQGVLLAVDVRFILARALRQYDRKYEEALAVAQPLIERYPRNPMFLVLVGNLNTELGRSAKAGEYFRMVEQLPDSGSPCHAHVRDLARAFTANLH
jgi:tetratricopeptide (TPR) repeat protein